MPADPLPSDLPTNPLNGVTTPEWLDWGKRTLDLSEAIMDAFDRGGLNVIEVLTEERRKHRLRWWLTGGRHHLELVRQAILKSRLEDRDDG